MATSIEYGLIAALIAVAAIGATSSIGGKLMVERRATLVGTVSIDGDNYRATVREGMAKADCEDAARNIATEAGGVRVTYACEAEGR